MDEIAKIDNTYKADNIRWEYILSSMVMGDPFIHAFLMIMSKHADEKIGTMGVRVVNGAIQLAYSPTFFNKLTDSEVRWVLVHEVMHVVFHHCTNRNTPDERMHTIHNYACDIAINQLIPSTGTILKPRKEVIEVLCHTQYKFPPKLSMEQYYQLLYQKDQEDKQKGNGDGKGDGEGNDSGGLPGKDPASDPGQGSGGGGKDDPITGEGKGQLIDNHEGWSEEEAEIIDEMIRQKVDNLSRSDKSWGKVTGDLKELILAAQKSQIAWWRLLRSYLGLFASTKRETTMKRPNRRFGYPLPGNKRKHIDKILCCVDTSASISASSLSKFLTEMNTILETHHIDLAVFDTQIVEGPIPYTRKVKKYDFKGRGGTDFGAIMKLGTEGKYKCMVILTDGAAPAPEYPKGVKDIIWCLVDNGKPPVEWGKQIHVKEKPGMRKAA